MIVRMASVYNEGEKPDRPRRTTVTIRGHAENGVIVLDEDVHLPDGTKVTVEIAPKPSEDDLHPDVRRFSGIIPAGVDAQAVYKAERARSQ